MTRKQYIASGIVAAGLIVMLYVVPFLAQVFESVFPALIVGIVSLVVMAAAIFKGGLTDVKNP